MGRAAARIVWRMNSPMGLSSKGSYCCISVIIPSASSLSTYDQGHHATMPLIERQRGGARGRRMGNYGVILSSNGRDGTKYSPALIAA